MTHKPSYPDPLFNAAGPAPDWKKLQMIDAQDRLNGADWITTPGDIPPAGQRPAYEFRRFFTLKSAPSTATLAATAHGVYEAYLNGVRVGDDELTPGATSYRSTLYVQEQDITGTLTSGVNELRLVVSDGWFRGRCGARRLPDNFGTDIGVIARLDADGDPIVATGDGWDVAVGAIIASDLMDGQTTDFRRIGQESWQPAVRARDPLTADRTRLGWSPAPPVRRIEQYRPVSIVRRPDGRQIVDFGQNLNGWVQLRRLGPDGTVITLTHGEMLTVDGDLTQAHLDVQTGLGAPPLPVGQVDTVISRGVDYDVFEPRHTTHGFRYVAIDGFPDALTSVDITAHQVRTDLTPRGRFWSSDDRINGLHHIASASWHANSCDIPTDCPQRERWGYTGDFQIFARSAAFLDDIDGFGRKWLTSLADDQHDDGLVTNVAPSCGDRPDPAQPVSFDGSAGWGDASAIVPWELYRASGDESLATDFYALMSHWVDWAARAAANGRHLARRVARPTPAAHDTYLWDTGWHWGEWLEPGVPFDFAADHAIIATAYLARSARIVADVAALSGLPDDADRYRTLSENARAAWRTEFVLPDGRLRLPTQANYARGLTFGLFPAELEPAAAAHLAALVHTNDDHLSTGFLSTGMLLPALADHGYTDLAYTLLFQDTEPSWLTMLERGATTVWESWSGIAADGTPTDSLNHYSKGAVIAFLHEYVAGLRPLEPGYRRFQVRPYTTNRLRHAGAELQTRFGTIRSQWQWHDGRVRVEITVPDGTTAQAILPDGTVHEIGPGDHIFHSPPATEQPPAPPAKSDPDDGARDLSRVTMGQLFEDTDSRAILEALAPELSNGPRAEAMRDASITGVLAMAASLLGADRAEALQDRLVSPLNRLLNTTGDRD